MVGLTVIFSTFNGASSTLPRMLDALEGLEAPGGGWKLIAVDNASTDGSGRLLCERASRLPMTVLFEPRQGKNYGLNLALGIAEGDLVVFTDDDVIPPADWLVGFSRLARARPDYGVFGGAIHPIWPHAPPDWILACAPKGHFAWTDFEDGPADPLTIWGPNMAVRRSALDGHLFFEDIGPDGGSSYATGAETEFVVRLARAGQRCWHSREVAVGHLIEPAQLTSSWLLQRTFNHARGERFLEQRFAGGGPPLFDRRPATIADFLKARAFALAAKWFGEHEDRFRADLRLQRMRGDRAELDVQKRARRTRGRLAAGSSTDAQRLSRFLRTNGATRRAHYVGTLHDHLMRTHAILDRARASREACLGGGLHSVYGTNLLDYATVALSDRGKVRRAFGREAELLAYLFAVLDRPRTLAEPRALDATEAVVQLTDGRDVRLARPVFDELRRVECANLADQDCLKDYPALEAFWMGGATAAATKGAAGARRSRMTPPPAGATKRRERNGDKR